MDENLSCNLRQWGDVFSDENHCWNRYRLMDLRQQRVILIPPRFVCFVDISENSRNTAYWLLCLCPQCSLNFPVGHEISPQRILVGVLGDFENVVSTWSLQDNSTLTEPDRAKPGFLLVEDRKRR